LIADSAPRESRIAHACHLRSCDSLLKLPRDTPQLTRALLDVLKLMPC
jgi:hypothetical protein